MRILVSVDIEGVAGVTHPEQTRSGNSEYEKARTWMVAEANAAIAGAFAGGATEVLVNDSHGSFRNLIPAQLDARARLITGKPRYLSMMAGVEQSCDAVFMVGYHSKAHTRGVLAHTINSFAFRRICINGQELGEAGLYGALAGEYNAPVALIAGDDVFLAETLSLFPGALGVETKQAQGFTTCMSLSPQASCDAIRAQAQAAMAQIPSLVPFKIGTAPYTCVLETQTVEQSDLFCQWPTLERISANTLQFTGPSMEHVIRMLNCFSAMTFMLR